MRTAGRIRRTGICAGVGGVLLATTGVPGGVGPAAAASQDARPAGGGSPVAAAEPRGDVRPSRHAKHGLVGIAAGAAGVRGYLGAETLSGRPLPLAGGDHQSTSRNGGVFYLADDLPRHYVVTVRLANHSGVLRAFADRDSSHSVLVSVGTSAAVTAYRAKAGRWSRSTAVARTLRAMGLPQTTRLGFDDRLNVHYASYRRVRALVGKDIGRLVARIGRAAVAGGRTVRLYTDAGPTSVRTTEPLAVGKAVRADGGQARGILDDLTNVFVYGSALAADVEGTQGIIAAGSAAAQTMAALQGLSTQMTQVQNQISELSTQLTAATAQIEAAIAATGYAGVAATYKQDNPDLPDAITQLEALAAFPCPATTANPCTQAQGSAYSQSLAAFPALADSVADQIDVNISTITGVGNGGADGLLQLAWNSATTASAGGTNSATAGVGTTLLTAPVSLQAANMLNYWLGQLQQMYLVLGNLQASSSSNASYDQYLVNITAAYQQVQLALPSVVPTGMLLDTTQSNLWANLGVTNPVTATGVTASAQTGEISAFPATVDGGTALPAVLQQNASTWSLPVEVIWDTSALPTWDIPVWNNGAGGGLLNGFGGGLGAPGQVNPTPTELTVFLSLGSLPTVLPASFTATTTSGSTSLTVNAVGGGTLLPGMTVQGTGIPTGATITAGTADGGAGQYTLSQPATSTGTTPVAMTGQGSGIPFLTNLFNGGSQVSTVNGYVYPSGWSAPIWIAIPGGVVGRGSGSTPFFGYVEGWTSNTYWPNVLPWPVPPGGLTNTLAFATATATYQFSQTNLINALTPLVNL